MIGTDSGTQIRQFACRICLSRRLSAQTFPPIRKTAVSLEPRKSSSGSGSGAYGDVPGLASRRVTDFHWRPDRGNENSSSTTTPASTIPIRLTPS